MRISPTLARQQEAKTRGLRRRECRRCGKGVWQCPALEAVMIFGSRSITGVASSRVRVQEIASSARWVLGRRTQDTTKLQVQNGGNKAKKVKKNTHRTVDCPTVIDGVVITEADGVADDEVPGALDEVPPPVTLAPLLPLPLSLALALALPLSLALGLPVGKLNESEGIERDTAA
ncbi:hypothetical protein MSAN_01243600 [Mycena sanguinolenta]|uniref:Uncharacterized protein n=1 Tax=Mycena sanguinolenta TaxID=230812 RepID=A0A8H6YIT1_9AGAR|nr:hypothetical protein MSAN_01243600 [Mycena sanguinolenta]